MKKFELAITKAWQNQSPYLQALAPLSAVYGAVSGARKSLYDKAFLKKYHAAVPVLVIGNITVGGSGKTPLIIALVKYLQAKNVRVGVISRGYGRVLAKGERSSTPKLVRTDSTPDDVGDEPCLIVQSTAVPMAVGADRGKAIELLLAQFSDTQLIISDDGLQHYALHRDAEWIVVDGVRGFGNGKLLPQGFLREPVSRLDGATVVYHDKRSERYDAKALRMQLDPAPLEPLFTSTNPAPKPPASVYALSGIGYPERFFDTLQTLGFGVIKKPFADHHKFEMDDITPLTQHPIITTSKDAVKLRTLASRAKSPIFENIWVLPVSATLSESVYGEMDKLLQRFGLS
ncbi:tetraacyldisaccharide 4'-kinase [Moraxella caviae]|uniref:Tetraacyldisaccharide 4'-kinase n=1 Tax=Moraxella caviae TaxID=34060 RepID=A0A1T0A6V3_9GAMM|nr:tetraacyldisaccharide 4'-kinase [Moraxella caviae]OOR91061.1 tetraacyldisaccharide 4'-kinase [Moraxella caviae]STZ14247.1 Tetraacyldisaccharide 4'-kinase [Moraxella caviae]VEW13128.1 Tetraacyldisaccharide 4'-kinase [Moraxella caviae]